ncbi:MAG: glycosyltransferase, partial [Gemmatimonadota bacterium]
LQPDAQVLWLPDAVRRGRQLLRRLPHDAILATAPSYTNLLVGALLSRSSGLPLISDFRDEWDLSSTYWENAPRAALALAVQRRMQRFVYRRSTAILATTEASTIRIASRAAEAGATPRAVCIYNGWDADDILAANHAAPVCERRPDRVRLVYAGTLWNLTSVAPVADAVAQLARQSPELLRRLEVVAVGRKTPDQSAQLQRLVAAGAEVVDVAYSPHPVALATMQTADALLLLLSGVPGAERVAPAKVFEYLALRRPILAVMPEGEIAALVRASGAGAHFLPDDIGGIAAWLRNRLSQATPSRPAGDERQIARFERRALTGELALLLDELTGGVAR